MFKVGDIVQTIGGHTAEILSTSAPYDSQGVKRPLVVMVHVPSSITKVGCLLIFMDANGQSNSAATPAYNLLSNEPSEEEASLMAMLKSYNKDDKDADQQMLKIIRQLRKKK